MHRTQGTLALLVCAFVAGCGDDGGSRLYPGRVEGVVCDAKTGAPIAGATVIVTKWFGSAWDESPSTSVTTTARDGRFAAGTHVARHVDVEIGAEGYHPMGWRIRGKERFCLEPVTVRATAEVKTFTVGVRDGKPYGFRFDTGTEEFDLSAADVVWTSPPGKDSVDVDLQFLGQGGAVAIAWVRGRMADYFFEHQFEVAAGPYESLVRIRHRVGTSWFFRDARGANHGKALCKGTSTSGFHPYRNWHVEFDYVYGAHGERQLEPRWRQVARRYR